MFHKEGFVIIRNTLTVLVALNVTAWYFAQEFNWAMNLLLLTSVVFTVLVLQFFRNPKRNTILNDQHIIAPADGKVVVIEEVVEHEFFKDKRIQVSIFMSPLNVHVNRYPITGEVKYAKYHPGKFLVAWHPKSSIENERTTVVVENSTIGPILFRQIAGALARRIVMYSKSEDKAVQGKDMGFIKFGSRIDLFLPLDAKINTNIDDVVRGGETVIATC
jgi:phosphatidylserine decarboxylase